jgi:prepilin-type N-terminal cleavage/methylation domain-containing protein
MRQRLASDSGFTLIELLVSMTILVVGIFGTVGAVDSAGKLIDVSEHESVAAQIADRELDTAMSVPFNSASLSSTPVAGASAADDVTRWNSVYPTVVPRPSPGNASCSAAPSELLANDEGSATCLSSCPVATGAATSCPSAGAFPPIGTILVPSGSGSIAKYKIYRYVTWVNDVACKALCPNPTGWRGDYKRVTIAVQPVEAGTAGTTALNGSGAVPTSSGQGPSKPIVVAGIKRDPTRGTANSAGNQSLCGSFGIVC